MKKKHLAIGCAILAGVLVLLAPIVVIWLMVADIRGSEEFLNRPDVYEPVAETMALYCQSDAVLFPKYLGYAWFPEPLRSKGQGDGTVSLTGGYIEMGGGFHHYGYKVLLDESASSATTNVWRLYFYSEGSSDQLLTTVSLASSAKLSVDEVVDRVAAGYDSFLAAHPEDDATRKGKILFLVRYERTKQALQVCDEWITVDASYWLPRFTRAHLRSRLGNLDGAAADFASWVDKHKNFAHYIYLALFNIREGRPEHALAAVKGALNQPCVEPPRTSGNKFYLGHNGAVIAFSQQDYDLCLAMCDKLLGARRQEDSWRRKILKLKAAALAVQGNRQAAKDALAEISRTEDVTGQDRQVHPYFVQAVTKGETKFLKDYAKWKDEYDDLFSPFKTDELDIFGRDDIPTPYPKDWRSNVGF